MLQFEILFMLSVVVPIYNTGRYLDRCLSTIVKQTYRDIEIILVNDNSVDLKTIEIIKKWEKKDKRILLIDKKQNEGVDKARITGINECHGEYVTFVDSNDWLASDAFESMLSKIEQTGADIVKGNHAKCWLNGTVKKEGFLESTTIERVISHDELMDNYYLSFFGVNIIPVTVWGTVYRRSLFLDANIQPTGLHFGEDLVMNMKLFPFVRKFYQMEKVVYFYRQERPSVTGKYLDDWLHNFNRLYKMKMQQIEGTGYEKAIFYQKVELINYLKTFVMGCNLHCKGHVQECIAALQQELQDSIYRDLVSYMEEDKWKTMATFLEKGDACGFWSYVTENEDKKMTLKKKVLDGVYAFFSLFRD